MLSHAFHRLPKEKSVVGLDVYQRGAGGVPPGYSVLSIASIPRAFLPRPVLVWGDWICTLKDSPRLQSLLGAANNEPCHDLSSFEHFQPQYQPHFLCTFKSRLMHSHCYPISNDVKVTRWCSRRPPLTPLTDRSFVRHAALAESLKSRQLLNEKEGQSQSLSSVLRRRWEGCRRLLAGSSIHKIRSACLPVHPGIERYGMDLCVDCNFMQKKITECADSPV